MFFLYIYVFFILLLFCFHHADSCRAFICIHMLFFPADVYSRCSFSLSTLAHAFCSDLDPGVFRVTPGKLLS